MPLIESIVNHSDAALNKMIDFEENGTFSPFINDDLSCYLKSVVLYTDILLTREEPFFLS